MKESEEGKMANSKKSKLSLEQAKNIFWNICMKLIEAKLSVTETELGKTAGHSSAVTIYSPLDTTSALGSLQYYGGSLFKEGYVKNVELRFYFKYLKDKPELFSCVNQENIYRVKDGKIYLKYQFDNNHNENEINDFIEQLALNIQLTLQHMYGSNYSNLHKNELSESIRLLPIVG